jgi:hypothetical protein
MSFTYTYFHLLPGLTRGNFRPDFTNRSRRFWTLTRYPNYYLQCCVSGRDGPIS